MDDLEKFTETVRHIEKNKILARRHAAGDTFRDSLELVGDSTFLPHDELKGMTVPETIQALKYLNIDSQADKATTKAMNKIAKRFLEDIEDET